MESRALETALSHLRQADRLDPRSVAITASLGERLNSLRRYDEAIQTFDKGLAFAPANIELREGKVMALLGRGTWARREPSSKPPRQKSIPPRWWPMWRPTTISCGCSTTRSNACWCG